MFSQISSDVLDHILTSISDFPTLLSFILVTKGVHTVFESRPNSIIRTVAEHQVGPALPQALRVVRLGDDANEQSVEKKELRNLHQEKDVLTSGITRQEAWRLGQNSTVAYAFEALYSSRKKDRVSKSSQLSSEESLRFHRALYRYWLFCKAYCHWGFEETEHDDDEEDAENNIKFFKSFTLKETEEIFQVKEFFSEIAQWVSSATNNYVDSDSLICCGPAVILQCFTSCSLDPYHNLEGDEGHIRVTSPSIALDAVLNDPCNVNFKKKGSRAILDNIVGEFDECDECHSPDGVSLWCSSNWHLLNGHLDRWNLSLYLPGHLSQNLIESGPLRNLIGQPNFKPQDLIEKCLPGDTKDWSEGQDLCLKCVHKLLGNQIMQWLKDQKAQNNTAVQDDCWYGYNCRTQVHRPAHAAKLNHICEPTRGNA